MGQRHLFSSSQMFDADHNASWNHAEQPFVQLGRASAADSGSNVCPVENMSVDGAHVTSNWNPSPGAIGYPSFTHNVEMQHQRLEASGPSHDPFLHTSASENFSMVLENFPQQASSSTHCNYSWQTFPGVDGGFCDLSIGNGRGPYKRKSPSVPVISDRGSTSRYCETGSSSGLSMSSNSWQEKANTDTYQPSWDCHNVIPAYRGNGLSIGGEGTSRNVRSRAALNFENNSARTHLSGSPPLHSYPLGHPPDSHGSGDHLGQSSNSSTMAWGYPFNSPTNGRRLVCDTPIFSHDANLPVNGSSNSTSSLEIGGLRNDFILSRNSAQNLSADSSLSVRGARSSHTQRSTPAFRNLSSNFHTVYVPNNEGFQLVSDNHSSRHVRQFPVAGWRNSDRNGRSRISSDRFRPFPDEVGFHDRLTTEGLMIVDRSGFSGSRNLFDHHRDMRLDIDNMSYEDLLALGERIGNVNTGLSENLASKCLMESVYCSSDQVQEDGKCVICLEEYKNMDDVGTMKACNHDFHVRCIRKWLSMKSVCPICKASAMPDNMKAK